jgi:hypothetical protein
VFNINLKEIRYELENIAEINEVVKSFQKSSELHSKEFLRDIYHQDIPMKIALLSSHLKEKNEISERLRALLYNLSTLRSSILTKDRKEALKIINDFLKNTYSGVSVIANELNDFKKKINKLDSHYRMLMSYVPKTLDYKLTTEAEYKKYIGTLHSIHQKQKEIFLNISKLFMKLSKVSIKKLKK